MTTTMITYPNGERTVHVLEAGEPSGFDASILRASRHSCGQFATHGRKAYNIDGVIHRADVFKCNRCDVTIISKWWEKE